MIKSIAIDDEPMALEVIKAHCSKVEFISLIQVFTRVDHALEYLNEHEIDLVFLDINMPEMNGLAVSQLLKSNQKFVFTTAYSDYAVQAFSVQASDYLLKPIDYNRFLSSCVKINQELGKSSSFEYDIFVKEGYDFTRIILNELYYIESDGNYLKFIESNKKTLARMTMAEALEILPASRFIKIHKSYIVNINQILKIERNQVILKSGQKVPLSVNFRVNLMNKIT